MKASESQRQCCSASLRSSPLATLHKATIMDTVLTPPSNRTCQRVDTALAGCETHTGALHSPPPQMNCSWPHTRKEVLYYYSCTLQNSLTPFWTVVTKVGAVESMDRIGHYTLRGKCLKCISLCSEWDKFRHSFRHHSESNWGGVVIIYRNNI